MCRGRQGGHLQIGAPTGKWQLVVVYRGKHDPVSKNYLASLQQIIYELDELGVEVVAVSGDGRERAEAFVRPLLAPPLLNFFTSVFVCRSWLPLWVLVTCYSVEMSGMRSCTMTVCDTWRRGEQLESLRNATDAKEITFKVAYGLPLSEQQRWGLYVSTPRNIRETDQPFPEPALLLLNPDGELVIVDVSNSPFARPDLRILVEGEATSCVWIRLIRCENRCSARKPARLLIGTA